MFEYKLATMNTGYTMNSGDYDWEIVTIERYNQSCKISERIQAIVRNFFMGGVKPEKLTNYHTFFELTSNPDRKFSVESDYVNCNSYQVCDKDEPKLKFISNIMKFAKSSIHYWGKIEESKKYSTPSLIEYTHLKPEHQESINEIFKEGKVYRFLQENPDPVPKKYSEEWYGMAEYLMSKCY